MVLTGNIFTEERRFKYGEVEIDEGLIKAVRVISDGIKESENYILPGFTDIHTHGCVGHDTCDGDVEAIIKMAEFELSQGVTSYYPTTMTFDEERLTKVVKAVAEASKTARNIKGIYLEGPFISLEKCGAQNPKYITKPDYGMIERLNEASEGLVRFVAIAPETEGALDVIKKGSEKYNFSIAHTTANYDTATEAIKAGAKHVTHFYNAMPAYSHRAPGVIGAAMDFDGTVVELICDGIHVHPAVVRNTFKFFGGSRICLISDSMEATGMPNGKYSLGGQEVFVTDRHATLKDGTLAGSASTLWDCFKQVLKMGVPVEEAVTAAAVTPAKEAGIFERFGSISEGKVAELIVTDDNFEILEVIG